MKCRHCRRWKAVRPRNLCTTCYFTPAVRALYPSTSKYARRGSGLANGSRPIPPEPTTARPGSEEKLAVLERRLGDGVGLWHPDDVTITGDER